MTRNYLETDEGGLCWASRKTAHVPRSKRCLSWKTMPPSGIEPRTFHLQGRRSATELWRSVQGSRCRCWFPFKVGDRALAAPKRCLLLQNDDSIRDRTTDLLFTKQTNCHCAMEERSREPLPMLVSIQRWGWGTATTKRCSLSQKDASMRDHAGQSLLFKVRCCCSRGSSNSSCLTQRQLRTFLSPRIRKTCYRCRATGIQLQKTPRPRRCMNVRIQKTRHQCHATIV